MSIILQDINFIQPQHYLTQINKALPSLSKKDLSLVDFYKSVSNTIKEFNWTDVNKLDSN
jgi:hypothetical protein